DYKINVSISFLDGPNLINIFTKRNDKVIVSVRGFPSKKTKDFYDFIGKNFIKQFYNKADLVVGVSNLVNKDLANNYKINKDKLVTLYNPFDLNNIQALSNESVEFCERNIFDKKVIITVGRLDDLKGHWHLIRAFKKVNNIDKDTKLVILGEGELRGYLQVLINDLYLENSVYLLGFKDNPYKYIAKSSLFVLPSLSEGFPNALVEAMSCGVPVISSDCKSGPREILAPETNIEYQCYEVEYAKYGVLTPSFDGIKYDCREPLTREENILADSILNLLINEDLYNKYSIKSLERAENFEINSIIKQWEILID
ncbi:MAG TPA: glycosyltransferase, partial [Erysipelotrichaceae bacterium]|nr:glycosyltransferase [Erysipelotrichaceae bacterium]